MLIVRQYSVHFTDKNSEFYICTFHAPLIGSLPEIRNEINIQNSDLVVTLLKIFYTFPFANKLNS